MKRLLLFLALIASTGLALSGIAHADVNDFTITNFTADYYLSKADPQGKLEVHEQLTVDFTDYNHGILRAIPEKYNGQDQHIDSITVLRDGNHEPYTTYTSNDNKVLKIGQADQTITGRHTYDINYTVVNVIRFNDSGDQLIWNTNGTQWSQPFLAETATLHIANSVNMPSGTPVCYTGAQGGRDQACTVNSDGRTIVFKTTQPLGPGQTMTFATDFPIGTFREPTAVDWWRDHLAGILEFLLPVLLVVTALFLFWYTHGRDDASPGTIVPEYAPPKGITPLEAGTIADFKVDNRDITATLIDLARKGYFRIIEQRTDRPLLKDKITYTLELQVTDWSKCSPYELQLLGALFSQPRIGAMVDVGQSAAWLYKTAQTLRDTVSKNLAKQGYFRRSPYRFVTYGTGALLLLFAFFLYDWMGIVASPRWPLILGLVTAGLASIPFVRAMPARTKQGVEAYRHLLGLKMYMETAEKERMEKLEGPNAAYATNAGLPERTVELFEVLLPYAIVLQVEKQWAVQFDHIYTAPPAWYQGNWTAFNAGYLAASLNDGFGSAINTSFAAPSTGGSGFGGGFAGGGGGGGGGW